MKPTKDELLMHRTGGLSGRPFNVYTVIRDSFRGVKTLIQILSHSNVSIRCLLRRFLIIIIMMLVILKRMHVGPTSTFTGPRPASAPARRMAVRDDRKCLSECRLK